MQNALAKSLIVSTHPLPARPTKKQPENEPSESANER